MFSKSWQPKGLTNQYVFTMLQAKQLQTTCTETDKHGYCITKQGSCKKSSSTTPTTYYTHNPQIC